MSKLQLVSPVQLVSFGMYSIIITCAEILIIIIKLNSEVFKCLFEVIIIIKLRFEVLDCPCELQTSQSLNIRM
jgi:hypothetical protein